MSGAEAIEQAKATLTLKQYRVCGACRARTLDNNCDMEFKTHREYPENLVQVIPGFCAKLIPDEPCYKPLTIPQYIAARNLWN